MSKHYKTNKTHLQIRFGSRADPLGPPRCSVNARVRPPGVPVSGRAEIPWAASAKVQGCQRVTENLGSRKQEAVGAGWGLDNDQKSSAKASWGFSLTVLGMQVH